ncbi:MAG: hypothetical protein PSX71_11335 [bacterium]|nr:hypothetical protein [bacterium]
MEPSVPLKALILVLTGLSAVTFAAGQEERPRLESYPSSYEFLQALQTWNRAHPDGTVTLPRKAAEAPAAPSLANIDPTSELAPPPITITGPENLDSAVEKARFISHPAYKEKIRYHRSTHISFPLHSIGSPDMSQASIGDALNIKNPTEEEKQLSDASIANGLDQDQRKLKSNPIGAGTDPITTSPLSINESMMTSGPHGRVNISVSGH